MIRIGIIGFSEGNGHPFSFSAILNGYSSQGFQASGWAVIHDYLKVRDKSEIGNLGARVTHVWTQDKKLSQAIAAASLIDHVADSPEDMIGEVDAVMVLRDDYESHFSLARLFLDKGIPVFIDKPLTLDQEHLKNLLPEMEAGQLFSTAGLRFARETDIFRTGTMEPVKLYRAAVLNDWKKYGVHMIDTLFGVTTARPVAVTALPAGHESFAVELDDGAMIQIDCLGNVGKVFRFEAFTGSRHVSVDLYDNFSAFRRVIYHFIEMIRTKQPPIPPQDTITSMKTLISGLWSLRDNHRRVLISEVEI